jgi:hypothetical protein
MASPSYSARASLLVDEFDDAVKSLIRDAIRYAEQAWQPARIDGWERYHGKIDITEESIRERMKQKSRMTFPLL